MSGLKKESAHNPNTAQDDQGPFQSLTRLILASESPRRRAFLQELGIDFAAIAPEVDEKVQPGESPHDFVSRAAREKAESVSSRHPDAWVLGADTVVVVDNDILGKPADADEALAMLKRLANRQHEVMTGFHICCGNGQAATGQVVSTEVCFSLFSEEAARAYVQSGESLDKAGAYGIQGRGGFLVEKIKGSYSNVVGLPLAEVVRELLRLGIIAPAKNPESRIQNSE